MIIYRELLKKYILHVATQEGVDFLYPTYWDKTLFTEDEWKVLMELSEEIQSRWNIND